MNRRARAVGWSVAAVILTFFLLAVLRSGFTYENAGVVLALLAMGLLGALIVGRQPANRMGWVFAAVGLLASISSLGDLTPAGPVAVLASGLSWWLLFFSVVVLIPLLFPSGRVHNRRWSWVLWISSTAIVILSVLWVFQEEICLDQSEGVCIRAVDNPVGIRGIENPEVSPIGNAALFIVLLGGVASLVSLFVRFRRGQPIVRLQIKWLLWAISLFIGWVVLVDIIIIELGGVRVPDLVYGILIGLVWLAIPLGAGVAIFRYRLFEIDRLVSRTVAYSLVVASLAAVYFVVIGLFSQTLGLEGDLAVASATLASAAVFSPLQRRMKDAVDRKFNRPRYDAGLIVERLAQRMTNVTDARDVVGVTRWAVGETVQPVALSIWIKESSGR